MIYISTGGISNQTGSFSALGFNKGINAVELSGGLYSEKIEEDLFNLQEIRLTNSQLFSLPIEPFVFNLASKNKTIFNKSFKHAGSCIELASKLGLSNAVFMEAFV